MMWFLLRNLQRLVLCTFLCLPSANAWITLTRHRGSICSRCHSLKASASDTEDSSVTPTTTASVPAACSGEDVALVRDVPPGHGLYHPFAQAFWKQLTSTGWFQDDEASTGFHTERIAPAKGFPDGSRVRMTVRSMAAKPEAPVAYARYALLETLVATEHENDDDSVSPSARPQHHIGIQVLNAVILPRPEQEQGDSPSGCKPVWGADFVALPGNKHLLLLDAQPMMANDTAHESFAEWYDSFDVAETWPWAGDIPPEVQPYVSPKALWTRLGGPSSSSEPQQQADAERRQPSLSSTNKIAKELLPVMEAHLQVYLTIAETVNSNENDSVQTSASWLRPYLEYRLSKDPARPMLQSLYGKQWTEDILERVLFPLEWLFGKRDDDA